MFSPSTSAFPAESHSTKFSHLSSGTIEMGNLWACVQRTPSYPTVIMCLALIVQVKAFKDSYKK
jgi:hypothetical protein